ncbi:fasciclin-like arabinogalactan protein 14 [Panicum miliaceum]|uniref:Fasciclin-like arabinogalactan protein 14 n=1 Tax=Panicum miliaceum TaxID=4540 RepID=A0A3L6PGG6_PANMI|nr:fasciclin-like arabinogalactan protein 14 [Panicum miliaceum]
MAPHLPLLVLLFLVLPAAGDAAAATVAAAAAPRAGSAAAAFNVTEILARYPEFKLFNLLLSKTRVAREINSRNSVTVLVPDNSAVDWLLRRSNRLARASLIELMSVHVVLDYIDAAKLAALPARGQPAVVTTLFQTTGTARNRTGFLNVTAAPRGGAVFVSAAPGSLVSATLKRAVTARPYNISVLQISNFVVPPGVVTRPRPPSPLMLPRMRQMSIAPSPAPTTSPRVPPAALPTSEGDAGEAPDAAEAPAPSSHGHVAQQATSRWWIGAAVGMALACTIGYL